MAGSTNLLASLSTMVVIGTSDGDDVEDAGLLLLLFVLLSSSAIAFDDFKSDEELVEVIFCASSTVSLLLFLLLLPLPSSPRLNFAFCSFAVPEVWQKGHSLPRGHAPYFSSILISPFSISFANFSARTCVSANWGHRISDSSWAPKHQLLPVRYSLQFAKNGHQRVFHKKSTQ